LRFKDRLKKQRGKKKKSKEKLIKKGAIMRKHLQNHISSSYYLPNLKKKVPYAMLLSTSLALTLSFNINFIP
jgi:hypothetical protein